MLIGAPMAFCCCCNIVCVWGAALLFMTCLCMPRCLVFFIVSAIESVDVCVLLIGARMKVAIVIAVSRLLLVNRCLFRCR